jgi:Flp pilus assembly protein protease CpaA
MILDIVSLGIFFLIGTVVAIEDIQDKKIKNKWIAAGLISGCLALAGAYFSKAISGSYVFWVTVNAAISFAVGFMLWKLGFWPAGDAKFFSLAAFLVPLHFYNGAYLDYFPSFVLLFNIFMLFLIFILLKMVVSFSGSALYFWRHNRIGRSLIKRYARVGLDLMEKRFKKDGPIKIFAKPVAGLMVYSALSILYFKRSFRGDIFVEGLVLFVLAGFLLELYINSNKKRVSLKDLSVGQNLHGETLKDVKKKDLKRAGSLRPEGLTEEQVVFFKGYFSRQNIGKIYLSATVPFSPWIILGVLYTLIAGNIFRF